MAARQAGYHPALIERSEESETWSPRASLLSIIGLSFLGWVMIGSSLFMVFR